jgi:F-type H+-transporting ATPase subunit b
VTALFRSALAATFILVAVPVALAQSDHQPPHAEEHGAAAKGEGHADDQAGGEHRGGHDAGHGAHGLDPKRLALQLLNFAVLAAILGFFGGKGINKALASRHEQMKKDLEEAAQARAAAEGRLAHQERRMTNLEKEIAALRASIKEEAINEEQRLVAAAEEKARRVQDETRFLMEQQVKEAELRFRAEVAGTAVKVAEELVRRSVRPEDTTRLQQGFIADLETGAAAQGDGKGSRL